MAARYRYQDIHTDNTGFRVLKDGKFVSLNRKRVWPNGRSITLRGDIIRHAVVPGRPLTVDETVEVRQLRVQALEPLYRESRLRWECLHRTCHVILEPLIVREDGTIVDLSYSAKRKRKWRANRGRQVCEMCGKSYLDTSNLRRHKRLKHM